MTLRLARFGPVGAEIPAVSDGDRWLDARSVTTDYDAAFFGSDGLARLRSTLHQLPPLDPNLQAGRKGAPIARPSAVVCIGMNYAAHAAESGAEAPERPVVFLKLPNTVVGPEDPVTIPRRSEKSDWEVELGIVVGARAEYLESDEAAMACVAGYVLVNDLSEREFQIGLSGGQWSKGKCCSGFTPCGPWLVPANELTPGDLRLRSWVNGERRQDSSTADMVHSVATIMRDLSQYMVLEPGDLVLTGTPEGVALSGRFPYLRDGDVVEMEIDHLGRQRTKLRAYEGKP